MNASAFNCSNVRVSCFTRSDATAASNAFDNRASASGSNVMCV